MLYVDHLSVQFLDEKSPHPAVGDVSFHLSPGEILGLVGESGSGKTVTAMAVSGLLPRNQVEVSGSITLSGQELLQCTPAQLRAIQGKDLAVIFQEPMTSLNPVLPIGLQVAEALRLHTNLNKAQRKAAALEALAMAELPERVYDAYPHQLSGGMLQRAMIAAAIISRPKLLLADEPTTALDVTVQSQILKLLQRLNQELNMGILFISHDLRVVRRLCSRVLVMQGGAIVEQGDVEEIFHNPQHPYTRALIDAIPRREKR